jgi:hypothetical protein
MDCSSTSAQKSEEEARKTAIEGLYMLRFAGPKTAGLIPSNSNRTFSLCVVTGHGTIPGGRKITNAMYSPGHSLYNLVTFNGAQLLEYFGRPNYICVKLYRNSEVVNGSDVMISSQDLNGSDSARVFDPSWGRSHVTLPGFELRKYCNTIVVYTMAAGSLTFVTYSWLFISPQRICLYTMTGEELPVLVTPYGPFVKYN